MQGNNKSGFHSCIISDSNIGSAPPGLLCRLKNKQKIIIDLILKKG